MADVVLLSSASPSTQIDSAKQPDQWSLGVRIAFRFSFCYLLLFGITCLFLFAGYMQLMTHASYWDVQRFDPWEGSLNWICANVYRIKRPLLISADSDFLSGYLQHLSELILAVIVTLLWSILDRRRAHYRRLYEWFALFMRFSLAIVLFKYGFDKVFPMQFGAMTPARASQQVGNLDMFNMLWIFMASSKPYTILCGAMEVLAGVLLIIPRMEKLGALFAIPVLANVFVLNIYYGVPVKIVSSHLLLVALFLAAPVLLDLFRLCVLRNPVRIVAPAPFALRRSLDRAAHVGITTLGSLMAVISCAASHAEYSRRQVSVTAAARETPSIGLWVGDTFAAQAAGQQSLFTPKLQQEYRVGPGTDRWLALAIDSPKQMTIELFGGVHDTVDLAPDSQTGFTEVTDSADPQWNARLAIQTIGSDQLTMQGTVNGLPVSSTWHRRELSEFRLMKGGIQWIQSEPH